MAMLDNKKVVLGVTGGIAAYKAAYLARELMRHGATVGTILTESATRFVAPLTFESLTEQPCRTDADMFGGVRGQTHVSLARGLDLLVIAPCTATTLAALATGSAGNMLTATALAASCPVVVSPAMHTNMWLSPQVQRNVEIVSGFPGYVIVPPDEGDLASGDTGPGRFPPLERIISYCIAALTPQTLRGRTVVVTAGPTREPIDPVRVITNPSTGRMGVELANAAARLGASVRLILGPCEAGFDLLGPGGPHTITRVETTGDMLEAVRNALPGSDALLMAAAPADERPVSRSNDKIGKDGFGRLLPIEPTPDILATLRQQTRAMAVLAFAAETGVTAAAATAKLERKGADLLFANPVGGGRGFGNVPDGGILVGVDSDSHRQIPPMTKDLLAALLLDEVSKVIAKKNG
ncbi:MAG TPA: bifunctional phosphopantothenoylcysteine decarboxylase/phosphopantothenate--cysteine ligase CoaBC [Myxococcota bacterium]|nr:bifunctional phosphopantothenoylcysteine decarboxylase/phosphopantothenate--cysteine ligase CoaBC [Myxococcota bacterium]